MYLNDKTIVNLVLHINESVLFYDLKSFQETGGYNDIDYFYYEVKIRDILEIGAKVYYKQKSLYVREYQAYKEETFYKYKSCI